MDGFEVVGLRLDLVVLMWATIGLFTFAALLVGVGMLIDTKSRHSAGEAFYYISAFFGVVASLVGLIWVAMLIPFQPLYHHWYGTAGAVESVTNIFEGGSGEISPGYVVELNSVDAPLLFDDPRILRMAGEEISVTCSVEWVPSDVDRLNCWIA